jgi:hypothetical protein
MENTVTALKDSGHSGAFHDRAFFSGLNMVSAASIFLRSSMSPLSSCSSVQGIFLTDSITASSSAGRPPSEGFLTYAMLSIADSIST